jgi:diacylglycerol kinase family enzyme
MAMKLIAHKIGIIRAINKVIKIAKTGDIAAADTGKVQNKNHFHNHQENGKN